MNLEILEGWRKRLVAAQTAHYRTANQLGKYNIFLGIPVVVLSATSASLIFYNPIPHE